MPRTGQAVAGEYAVPEQGPEPPGPAIVVFRSGGVSGPLRGTQAPVEKVALQPGGGHPLDGSGACVCACAVEGAKVVDQIGKSRGSVGSFDDALPDGAWNLDAAAAAAAMGTVGSGSGSGDVRSMVVVASLAVQVGPSIVFRLRSRLSVTAGDAAAAAAAPPECSDGLSLR
eukprot:jgi/Psemu1/284116/fgenesh1_pg.43_\